MQFSTFCGQEKNATETFDMFFLLYHSKSDFFFNLTGISFVGCQYSKCNTGFYHCQRMNWETALCVGQCWYSNVPSQHGKMLINYKCDYNNCQTICVWISASSFIFNV